jgi:copper chaperone
MAQPQVVVLKAPDISCMHCVGAIKKAVGGLQGVAAVDADAGTKLVKVSFDPDAVSLETIRSTMAAEGYPVQK